MLLAISAFSLSLLGTFLVRSGVLTSVHAFASDPERGRFILYFLGVVIGGSLTLYAARASQLKSFGSPHWFSREGFLLSNNLILVVGAVMVLLGTYTLCLLMRWAWAVCRSGRHTLTRCLSRWLSCSLFSWALGHWLPGRDPTANGSGNKCAGLRWDRSLPVCW